MSARLRRSKLVQISADQTCGAQIFNRKSPRFLDVTSSAFLEHEHEACVFKLHKRHKNEFLNVALDNFKSGGRFQPITSRTTNALENKQNWLA